VFFEKGLSSSDEMVTISEVSDVLTCQDRCQEQPNCKIFYWKGESSTCKIAEFLYVNETKIINEINSIIGRPNCSNYESGWHHSIFITRPQKSQTGFIVGSVLAVLVIGSVIALVLVRQKRKQKSSRVRTTDNELQSTNQHQKVNDQTKRPGIVIICRAFKVTDNHLESRPFIR
jgi:hypothetical protein